MISGNNLFQEGLETMKNKFPLFFKGMHNASGSLIIRDGFFTPKRSTHFLTDVISKNEYLVLLHYYQTECPHEEGTLRPPIYILLRGTGR